LDLQLKTTSGDEHIITVESSTSKNVGIAVEISLITALEPEISCTTPVTKNGCKKSLPLEG